MCADLNKYLLRCGVFRVVRQISEVFPPSPPSGVFAFQRRESWHSRPITWRRSWKNRCHGHLNDSHQATIGEAMTPTKHTMSVLAQITSWIPDRIIEDLAKSTESRPGRSAPQAMSFPWSMPIWPTRWAWTTSKKQVSLCSIAPKNHSFHEIMGRLWKTILNHEKHEAHEKE